MTIYKDSKDTNFRNQTYKIIACGLMRVGDKWEPSITYQCIENEMVFTCTSERWNDRFVEV